VLNGALLEMGIGKGSILHHGFGNLPVFYRNAAPFKELAGAHLLLLCLRSVTFGNVLIGSRGFGFESQLLLVRDAAAQPLALLSLLPDYEFVEVFDPGG